jgi:hypothetical protein
VLDDLDEKNDFKDAVASAVSAEFVRDGTSEIRIVDIVWIQPRHLGQYRYTPNKLLIEFEVFTETMEEAQTVRGELWDLATLQNQLANTPGSTVTGEIIHHHYPRIMTNYHECRKPDHRFGSHLKEGTDASPTPVRNKTVCGGCTFATDWDTRAYMRRQPTHVNYSLGTHVNVTGNDLIPDGTYHITQLSTWALNRTAGDCSSDCVDVLDLSYPNMDFLHIPKGVFDNLPNVYMLSLAGNGITGVPEGAFDGLAPNATIDLRCTNITCVPKVLPDQTLLLPEHVHPGDECKRLDPANYGRWCTGCEFFVNAAGLLSRGGECRHSCQELDLRNTTYPIEQLPYWPNGAFDSMLGMKLLHLPSHLVLRPMRHFAYEDWKDHMLIIHQWPEESWQFVRHWYKRRIPEIYSLIDAMGNAPPPTVEV